MLVAHPPVGRLVVGRHLDFGSVVMCGGAPRAMAEACRPDKVLKPHHAGWSFVQRNNPSVRLWHGSVVRLGGTSTSCVASMGGECRNVRGPGPI
ncbi:hypothetical protein ME121_3140 [Methylobacterium sp. ME121]|nr:hypothetical protein ME121_3140 [Methylobacterium sp. ME121]